MFRSSTTILNQQHYKNILHFLSSKGKIKLIIHEENIDSPQI